MGRAKPAKILHNSNAQCCVEIFGFAEIKKYTHTIDATRYKATISRISTVAAAVLLPINPVSAIL